MDRVVLRKFGERVRQLRLGRKLSQEVLADEAGLDRSYIGGVERGERNVSLVNIERIARALGVGLGDLVTFATTHSVTPRAGRKRR